MVGDLAPTMTVAAETRRAVRASPFLRDALRAGCVNYTAAARFLDVGDEDAVVAALRRYAEDLPDLEADIAQSVGDKVRVAEKVRGMGRPFDEASWDALLSGYDVIDTYDFDHGLSLDAPPVPETMLTGTVRGTKGRVLVLDRGETTYAVDMRDLVGYDVEEGGDDGDRQASLGSF